MGFARGFKKNPGGKSLSETALASETYLYYSVPVSLTTTPQRHATKYPKMVMVFIVWSLVVLRLRPLSLQFPSSKRKPIFFMFLRANSLKSKAPRPQHLLRSKFPERRMATDWTPEGGRLIQHVFVPTIGEWEQCLHEPIKLFMNRKSDKCLDNLILFGRLIFLFTKEI